MKKILFAMIASAVLFASCQSKEKKAEELIKSELSKTLYDFDSYQPIETTVKEAKATIFNDTTCWKFGALLAYAMQETLECIKNANNAKEHMDIWGPPSYYSSTYSDNQYYKYKAEYEKANDEAFTNGMICKATASLIKKTVAKLDTTKIIGWEVSHRFRCKTKGGNSDIGNYRYIIDTEFKNILLREDTGSDEDKQIRDALESAQTDYWDNIDFGN